MGMNGTTRSKMLPSPSSSAVAAVCIFSNFKFLLLAITVGVDVNGS